MVGLLEGKDTKNTEYLSYTKGSCLALCTHILMTDPCRKALLVAPSSMPGRRETEAQELGEQRACVRAEDEAGPQGHQQHPADCSCQSLMEQRSHPHSGVGNQDRDVPPGDCLNGSHCK